MNFAKSSRSSFACNEPGVPAGKQRDRVLAYVGLAPAHRTSFLRTFPSATQLNAHARPLAADRDNSFQRTAPDFSPWSRVTALGSYAETPAGCLRRKPGVSEFADVNDDPGLDHGGVANSEAMGRGRRIHDHRDHCDCASVSGSSRRESAQLFIARALTHRAC